MIRRISTRYLCFLDIYLDYCKVGDEIGKHAIDSNISNRLVFCHRFIVEGRDIDHPTIGVYQIDI